MNDFNIFYPSESTCYQSNGYLLSQKIIKCVLCSTTHIF